MGIGDAVGKAVIPAIDKLVETRYEPARRSAARLREAHPNAKPPDLADALIRTYRKELGAVGAAAGGTSAIPGAGTAAGVVAGVADAGWTTGRLGELILSIGAAYGHGAEQIEQRRAWVLAVLGMATGASSGLTGVAAQVGTKGGVKIVNAIPISQIVRINRALGGRIIVKFGTKQGAVRLGRLVPFGVGAAIGGGGNVLLVRAVGNRAKDFFDDGLAGVAPEPGAVPSASSDATVPSTIHDESLALGPNGSPLTAKKS